MEGLMTWAGVVIAAIVIGLLVVMLAGNLAITVLSALRALG